MGKKVWANFFEWKKEVNHHQSKEKLASAIINFIAPCVFHTKQIIITLNICTYVFNTCIPTPSLYATF